MGLSAWAVYGQAYPDKPIRVVTTAPGGGSSLAARLIAPGLTSSLREQIVVDNRGLTAAETVAKAPPDGYTLLVYGSTIWLAPFLRDNVPYDPVRDFLPITLVASSPNVLVVNQSTPVNSVRDLVALAKAKPGALNYGSSAPGSASHLAPELLKAMAGVDIVRVNYKGGAQAITDLIGGQVQLMFPNVPAAMSHVKSGKIRAVAVTSAQPSELLPGIPTVAASGLPGYEAAAYTGMFAPARTATGIIKRLNQETVRVLSQADIKGKFLNTGSEIIGSSPEAFSLKIKSEMAKWGKLIKDVGIREE
jgi:tripartite-type tricarboxylate transporter receptor subunit TctC